jgi:hypothetical protein
MVETNWVSFLLTTLFIFLLFVFSLLSQCCDSRFACERSSSPAAMVIVMKETLAPGSEGEETPPFLHIEGCVTLTRWMHTTLNSTVNTTI